jgi:hypothetical protein
VSQPEENREKSAKTDAVLRPPSVAPKPAPPPSAPGRRKAAENEPAPAAPQSEEEEA